MSILGHIPEKDGLIANLLILEAMATSAKSLVELQKEIYEMAGKEFNINSPKQLGVILFDELGLPNAKKTKTGYSTNADVLEKLKSKHDIIPAIMDYRMLTKLKSTYADGLLKVIDEVKREKK